MAESYEHRYHLRNDSDQRYGNNERPSYQSQDFGNRRPQSGDPRPQYDRYQRNPHQSDRNPRDNQGNDFSHQQYETLGSKLTAVNFNTQELKPFRKDFYTENPIVTSRSEADTERFRKDIEITTFGNDVPRPVQSFEEANFPDYIIRVLKEIGFSTPTPIQCQGIINYRLACSFVW